MCVGILVIHVARVLLRLMVVRLLVEPRRLMLILVLVREDVLLGGQHDSAGKGVVNAQSQDEVRWGESVRGQNGHEADGGREEL